MSKPTDRTARAAQREAEVDTSAGSTRDASAAGSAARKPYQRPSIEKRRSLREATFQIGSTGGASGVLSGGSGP